MNQNDEFIPVVPRMPPDETIVEVKLRDGSTRLAWYSCNIMEAGDWDFLPVEDGEEEPDIERESIADQVIGWRPRAAPRQGD